MLENQSIVPLPAIPHSEIVPLPGKPAPGSPAAAHVGRDDSPETAEGRFCTADELEVGMCARVVRVSARCAELRHKLLTLGVVAGTKLEVTAVAPLRDPMNVRLLGFTLSLRLCEASCITVEKISRGA